ncbi:RNA-directed DNA methylation 4 isoform X1 [Ananas comosus]|uniref:RNA-directed DNA methylation 4 isoform X1 n=1 Tax=Ananas comosus TaxID=4615 RepID=A0A6P5FYN1_ANACO|nr:RNA-directed DNA methylation 4 isoform X1 [Ananas comosus]XP_020101480.1 RNA-directed DNA methylation 4 isoform X1 [Ananas comosus]XP_020101481.1 RNA-directed DNA methylation 4 isoform X1 [Ananas comosus]XP_020101482.1 RNA-directed DNA methylation 4 isoform X1 [Ananas comosus]XP_020101483.1 RNA-directed DNA methylation 4 isoform X1 [Ananas comosus]
MAQPADPSAAASSSNPDATAKVKPVVVRVKRKSSQARLDAFWLEINERPLKRRLLDIGNLSISSSISEQGEAKPKKLLVQHVETVRQSEDIKDVLHSFLLDPSGQEEPKSKNVERKNRFKQDNQKQDKLRSIARQNHEDRVRSARFEQIWRSRKGGRDADNESLREICHLYDVVRVDVEDEESERVQKQKGSSIEDDAILCNYLPLIREYIPTAAAEIESDIFSHQSREDKYVYDLYTVEDGVDSNMEDAETNYPLVQVDDDEDYYDGPEHSEYETDDSNAEDNPLNDYPEEESSEDEDDENKDPFDDLDGSDSQYEDEVVEIDEDEENWRWEHR